MFSVLLLQPVALAVQPALALPMIVLVFPRLDGVLQAYSGHDGRLAALLAEPIASVSKLVAALGADLLI